MRLLHLMFLLRTVPGLILAVSLHAQQSTGPVVWFHPRDNAPWKLASGPSAAGSIDYLDLFTPSAPWQNAAARIQVFKVWPWVIFDYPEQDVRRMLADLKRRNIALALEPGPLAPEGCGADIEGFHYQDMLRAVRLIKQYGGDLKYVAMDEPYVHGSMRTETGYCQWPVERVAANAARNIAEVRRVFPDVSVGDIELIPPDGVTNGRVLDWVARYDQWARAFERAAGRPLAFFACDVDWQQPGYRAALTAARRMLRNRGIPFMVTYDGSSPTVSSDAEFLQNIRNRYEDLETLWGGPPDHVAFWSMNPQPSHLLPESYPNSFTSLVNTYFRERTALELGLTGGEATVRAATAGGRPMSGVPISLSAQPLWGQGVTGTTLVRGTVPRDGTSGLLQIGVNYGSLANHAVDVDIYSLQYNDTGLTKPIVFDFAYGLQGWAKESTRTAEPAVVETPQGKALRIQATPTQHVWLNSPSFSATPDATFELRITARVPPDSDGGGFVDFIAPP
ncbi:MAG: hypothetical protein NTY38_10770, partial [Acidobacteria bacterium]|nr:hypothetical protein [Acidobacteriota bacterium]